MERNKKIRLEINETKTEGTVQEATKSCFFKKINMLNKPLVQTNQKQQEKTPISEIIK
jgi:hypothetical protein